MEQEQQKKIFFIVLGVLVLGLVGVAMLSTNSASSLPGKVSNEAGATIIKGEGTEFTKTFKVGDKMTLGDSQVVSISTIDSDSSITTDKPIANSHANVVYSESSKYDDLAICLKDKGAVFYGAFWCPHCQAQKKLFEKSAKLLPYVECSTADAKAQTQICIDKGVQTYPTWEFADGSRLNGEISLAQLAEKTSCVLPVTE